MESGVVTRILELHPHVSAEQASMVRRRATSGAEVEVVVSKPGAGKTTALAVAREVLESVGYVISGTALSARAAEELEVSAAIPSVTLARLMGELYDQTRALRPRDILVVDEAGMVGTRTLGRLINETAASGAKLILVGDPRQLAEIDAGARSAPWLTASVASSSPRTGASTRSGSAVPSTSSGPAMWCGGSSPLTSTTASVSRRPWPQRGPTWSNGGWRPGNPGR